MTEPVEDVYTEPDEVEDDGLGIPKPLPTEVPDEADEDDGDES